MRKMYLLLLTAALFASVANGQGAVTVAGNINTIDVDGTTPNTPVDMRADEFTDLLPPCGDITGLTTTNITSTSVDLNWNVTGGASGYEYAVTTSATPPGSGTGTTNNFVTPVSGLSPGTVYYAHVRANCGAGNFGNWFDSPPFSTSCIAANVPYLERFDGVTVPALPVCITVQNVNGRNTWRLVTNLPSGDDPVSYHNFMRLDYDTDGTTPADDWFFTQGLNLTGGTSYRLRFHYRNSDGTAYVENLEVKYGTATNAASMTSGLLFRHTGIDFDVWKDTLADFTPSVTGVYYVGFHGFSVANQAFLCVDNVSVIATPACNPPTDVTIGSITSSGAVVSFNSPGSANFYLEYGPLNFTPGTGASAGGGTVIGPVASSPITIPGGSLTGSTVYDVYVRRNCGSSFSPNSLPRSFETANAPLANDDAPGALTLTVGAGCTGAVYSNVGATASANEKYPSCSGDIQAPVWFKFVAPASGAVRISTDLGSGNTFTDSKVAVFSTNNVNDYTQFSVISCDDDGGSLGSGFMSVVYATGLTGGGTYYIAVDKYSNFTSNGTFCIAVDELSSSMLASANTCASSYQAPSANINTTYTGWQPLVDAGSKLIALVKNPAGGSVDAYTVSQNINTAAVRQDAVSKEYYLNRNYKINNSTATNVDVQFFFLNTELTALAAVDPAATLDKLRVTRQTGTTCQDNFVAANGTNSELTQTGFGSINGVSWITVNTPAFSNFFIHSTKSPIITKVFLQGAYNAGLGRHKNVTPGWQSILATNALNQPYNTAAFGNYNGGETVLSSFFTSDLTSDRDVMDWVLLELKDGSNNLVGRRAALVREDGKILDTNGDSLITFPGLGSGTYYITIRHRNHLGISTQSLQTITAKALGVAPPTANSFDFTTETDGNIFGTSAAYNVVSGTNVMVCGNANSNTTVRYAGLNNDPASILVYLGGAIGGIISNVYSANDVNLDGTVRYAGLNNDPGFLLSNALGGTIGTIVTEQKR
jgi:hypothetical protein